MDTSDSATQNANKASLDASASARTRAWGSFADRHLWLAFAAIALLSALLAPQLDRASWERRHWSFLGERALTSLLQDANLPTEVAQVRERLSVSVHGRNLNKAQQRGIRDAVVRHHGVNQKPSSEQRLLVDVHRWGPVSAVELRLFRRGWALRMQSLERMIHVPWLPGMAMFFAALLGISPLMRRLGMPIAGCCGQAMLAFCRRGEPYRVLPVHWQEWPESLYAQLLDHWNTAVFHRPHLSVLAACLLLIVAWRVSAVAKQRGQSRAFSEILWFLLWGVGSVIWWDASFRATIPVSQLEGAGAGLMRLGHVFLAAAWVCSAVMQLRPSRCRQHR